MTLEDQTASFFYAFLLLADDLALSWQDLDPVDGNFFFLPAEAEGDGLAPLAGQLAEFSQGHCLPAAQ